MVTLLNAEQGDDDSKKASCLENFDKTEDDAKALAKSIVRFSDNIQESQDQLSKTSARIEVVQKSTGELDDSVGRGTEIRQKQYAEFVSLKANNAVATELLKLSVNRLNKFYAPKLHKSASKAEISADDRIYVKWVETSKPWRPQASKARMSHGCSCCGQILCLRLFFRS